jgi:quercetin dioxygenase-like cupin family protein
MAHTSLNISNPRTGQQMTFLQTARDTGGALLQVETINPPNRAPEPEHVHPRQESRAEVLEGALHFSVQGATRVLTAGEKLTIPANTPHYFWNEGPGDARAIQEFRPALSIEDFFTTWFGLARDGKIDERGMPSLLQLAVLMPAFGDEIRPTSPPWPLLRALGWVLGPLARIRGYRSVYPQYQAEVPESATH